jgi:hypothetical protein
VIIYQITGASTDIQNILLENNSFGVVENPGHGVSIGGSACSSDQPNNVVVENNTFYTSDTGDVNCGNGTHIAGTWRNNVMAGGAGIVGNSKLVFDYNVWSSGAVGSHAKTCAPAFVDPSHGNGNVDLKTSDTCAKDYVPTSTTHPATDMHGTARPVGAAVDAGADEAG